MDSIYGLPVVPERQRHTDDQVSNDYLEQTYLPGGLFADYNSLDATTRAVHPFIVPTARGTTLDNRSSGISVYWDRALKRYQGQFGRRFEGKARYEKLQMQHRLANEIRYNGPESPQARLLKWMLDNWESAPAN